jgi:hypothetical protein
MEKLEVQGVKSGTDEKLVEFILESFNVRTQTHIYHLLTKSYADHMAIGEFYDKLLESIDSISEMSIGLNISTNTKAYESKLVFNYDKATLINEIKDYRETVTSLLETTDVTSLMSINDAIMTIQAAIDMLLYKLQLN